MLHIGQAYTDNTHTITAVGVYAVQHQGKQQRHMSLVARKELGELNDDGREFVVKVESESA